MTQNLRGEITTIYTDGDPLPKYDILKTYADLMTRGTKNVRYLSKEVWYYL